MALHEKILAGIDSAVTLIGRYHSESGFPGIPPNPNLPPKTANVMIHYRPDGAIAHIQNGEGRLIKRSKYKTGVQLREHLGVKVFQHPQH